MYNHPRVHQSGHRHQGLRLRWLAGEHGRPMSWTHGHSRCTPWARCLAQAARDESETPWSGAGTGRKGDVSVLIFRRTASSVGTKRPRAVHRDREYHNLSITHHSQKATRSALPAKPWNHQSRQRIALCSRPRSRLERETQTSRISSPRPSGLS